jgi:hypothetical protein
MRDVEMTTEIFKFTRELMSPLARVKVAVDIIRANCLENWRDMDAG